MKESGRRDKGLRIPDDRPINTMMGDTRLKSDPQMAGDDRRHTGVPNSNDTIESEATKTR